MRRSVSAAAAAIAALLAIAVPTQAAQYPANPEPDQVVLDLAIKDGICIVPCAITATQPTETDQGEPFAFDPNGEWAGQIWTGKLVPAFDDDGNPDGTSHEHVTQTLGPPSPGIAFTATTPGRWTVNLSSASDFFGAKSENFYVLAPADAPAAISLSPRRRLHLGSLLAVRSPKQKLSVLFTGSDGGVSAVRPAKCRKPTAGVRCFKLRNIHYDLSAKATISVSAWNQESPQYVLDGIKDRHTFNVKLRCKRQYDYHRGKTERQCR